MPWRTWDSSSARACVVEPGLLDSAVPVLGTAAHVKASSCAFGIGVFSVVSPEEKRAVSLYYVSPKVALARGHSVEAGWYVVAVPGATFELRVTTVQPNFPRVKGEKLRTGDAVKANVTVNCTNVDKFIFVRKDLTSSTPSTEVVAPGFLESYTDLDQATVRKFVFQRAATTEAVQHSDDEYSGEISLRMFYGKSVPVQPKNWTCDLKTRHSKVSEKVAVKAGRA